MKFSVRRITFTAILTAINVILSSFHIPLVFANLYLTDVAVCLAGITLDPFSAIIAGGVGAFIGDFFFYPKAMIVTLIVRSVQSVVISVFSRYIMKNHPFISSLIGVFIGCFIMAIGYAYFAVFFYSTIEVAIFKLPEEFFQAAVGGALALLLCYKFRIREIFEKYFSG